MPFPLIRPSWRRFALQALSDLRLVAVAVGSLQLLRVLLLVLFRDNLDPGTGVSEIGRALGRGLGYDARVAFYVVLPGLLGTLLCVLVPAEALARRLRRLSGAAFLGLVPAVGIITFGYVREYGDQFNHFVLAVVYDDFWAVLRTVWAEYPLVWLALGAAVAGYALAALASRGTEASENAERACGQGFRSALVRAGFTLAFLGILAVAARGGFGRVPLQFRDRDVTQDAFLNRMVLNPFEALRYAVREHRRLAAGLSERDVLGPEGIRGALAVLVADGELGDDLDALFLRRAAGPKGDVPRHLFLIVLESYDAWPLAPPYREIDLLPEAERLGRDGLLLLAFLSASSGTGTTLSSLITGLHDSGVVTNYQPSAREPYPTAPAEVFRRLGYRTRLFYGGYLSWQRLGDFALDQGFEETYGRAHIPNPRQANEWGVDDASLFDLASRTVDAETPSFNLIVTTSYHPPYNFDVAADGWEPRTLGPELRALADGRLTDAMMGHLWASDRAMGRFVDRASQELTGSLFAVTGDHHSRKFLNRRPGLWEGSAVPLLLYGPGLLPPSPPPQQLAGGHLDIAPTLVELCAPEGFEYAALGRDLFQPSPGPVGFGRGVIIAPGFVADLEGDHPGHPLPWADSLPRPEELAGYRRTYRALIGVSWWRTVRGAALPPLTAVPESGGAG